MNKIGIFYGSTNGSTEEVAKQLQRLFGKTKADLIDIKDASKVDVEKYQNLIFGTSAWGIGDMQDDWERFIYHFVDIDFGGKKIALFGLGDQEVFPESFVDGLGTLYCRIPVKESVVGFTSIEGYNFCFSIAERDGKFVGLVLDQHNQKSKSRQRIANWVDQLKLDFNI
ncbi:MAG: flavodoxin [Bacteroidales bacterium]